MRNPPPRFTLICRWAVPAALAAWLAGPAPVEAQTELPQIAHILPAGGQRGTTVEAGVRGRHLVGATGVRVSGEGVTAKVVSVEREEPDEKKKRADQADYPDLARIAVTLAADAEPGQRDLRMVTPGGMSNRFRFYVGQVPEVIEAEPNNSRAEAQAIEPLPVVISGRSFQADLDVFRFSAKAGETLVLDVDGQKIIPYIADAVPGWYQPCLRLCDAAGNQVAYVDDFRHHPDPLMIYQVEKDGEYLVELKDALFRGRDDFVYRLSIGALPSITHIFPLGGQRGSPTEVKLYGANLPSDTTTVDLAGEPSSRREVKVNAGGFISNAKPFAVGELPEAMESEPNNAAEEAQRVETPVTVNGRIDAPGDVDHFVIAADAEQQLVFEIHARRLDSPMDSIVTLFDSSGRQLGENDDEKDESEGLVTHHADSRLQYTFPAAGDYTVAVRDVQGRGGGECAYRLTIAPPRPDFILRVRPDNPRTAQGSSGLLTVTAFRRDGFEAPIRLSLENLPPGFVVPEAVIPEAESEARMTLTAPEDAPIGLVRPKVVGTAVAGDGNAAAAGDGAEKPPAEAEPPGPMVREAAPSEELMQAFYYMHSVPSQDFLLTVVEAGPFTLSLDLPPGKVLEIPRRGEAKVTVKVAFKEGIEPAAVTLKAESPPKGFRVKTEPIPVGKNESTVTITTLGQEIRPGQSGTLILTGNMKRGKETVSGFVPAIPFEITK